MRWFVVAVAVVGCSTTEPAAPPSPPNKTAITLPAGPSSTGAPGEILAPRLLGLDARDAPPPAPPKEVVSNTPQPQLESPAAVATGIHGASITVLAATDDGSAAVSADQSGGIRLWPTLDGKREPVVIAATSPTRQLSIERGGKELVIARLDDTGTLELIRTSEFGEPKDRYMIDSERPIVDIRAIGSGVVALRDDGVVVRMNIVGELAGTLRPEPGQRITKLLYRRQRLLALLATATGVVGRWIEVEPLLWGATTAKLAIDPSTAALSPDLKSLAATNVAHTRVLIVALATGRVLARPIDREIDATGFEQVAIVGFTDAGTLALGLDGVVGWWQDATLTRTGGDSVSLATDRGVLGAHATQLALLTPHQTQFLGYRLSSPIRILPVRGGMLIGGDRTLLRINDEFAERVRYQLSPAYQDIIPIDGRHVVATSSANNATYCIDLDDPDNAKRIGAAGTVRYEPRTRVLSIDQSSSTILFLRYDPKSGTFDEPTSFTVPGDDNGWHSIELLDPALSKGTVAMVIRHPPSFDDEFDDVEETTLIEIRSVRAGAAPVSRTRRLHLTSEVRTQINRGDLTALGILLRIRRASPDGMYVAELGQGRLTLRRADGESVWMVPAAGVEDLGWSAGGELLAMGAGVGVVDLATGAFGRRRCGWDFGLWQDASPESGAGSQLCDLR